MTFKRPKLEVAARNQFLPDLINLKRVTRSVSRNSPFERLKNISVSLLHFLFPLHYRLICRFLEAIILNYCYFFIIFVLDSNKIVFSRINLSNRGNFLKKSYNTLTLEVKQKAPFNRGFSDNYLIFSNMLSMCWMDFSRPSK